MLILFINKIGDSMKKVMATVVMAIYNPNLVWLKEELRSIASQTFLNFDMIIWNDNPKDQYDYYSFFSQYLPNISFSIKTGKKNLGSNGAFEKLTELVSSPYIVYCDQDDIWFPTKMEKLVDYIYSKKLDLVCSDMSVYDENTHKIADSIMDIHPHYVFYTGRHPFEYLLQKNFVTGCTAIVKTEVAKKSLPFPEVPFHDRWLALNAAVYGKIGVIREPLIGYRMHADSQTSRLKGISQKNDYFTKRILKYKLFMDTVRKRFTVACKQRTINMYCSWADARITYYQCPSLCSMYRIWKLRRMNIVTTYFEIILPFLPEVVFRKILILIKKGIL